MSAFFDNSITDGGRQLYAEMQAGGTFVPTRIVIGSGYLPTGKTTRTVTSVAEPVKSIELNKKEKLKDIFIKATIHEMKFWDMAYKEEI